ncbi:hypothetical protein KUTeg_017193 [Tegillarca granosa]|uniref:Nucleolar protein 4 n=1 Tax=Tegillarca granosa TaxID=220873 RepID=A0ABQ9EN18_TEGGR|nr:hypothetical protein KUTeg_017193 [Tegillarca granosa]
MIWVLITIKIAETYAFLPREAVTRFLMACSDCQKRMHLSSETSTPTEHLNGNDVTMNGTNENEPGSPPVIDFSVPITQTYLNHMRNRGFVPEFSYNDEVSLT